MQAHIIQELQNSDSDELADLEQDDDDYSGQIMDENHVMIVEGDPVSSHSDEEDYNHQDTGSGDQGSNDFI